jgi:xanthine dehydrogenase YagS FAD-binding subunit
VALEAVVLTNGPRGPRALPIADFHTLPGASPHIESALDPGELVTHLTLPKTALAARSVYLKARDRASYAFALASAAVALELDGQQIKQARVALGGVASKPWRCLEVEQALTGKPATRAAFDEAAALALRDARTTSDNQFKVPLARRVLARALEQVGTQA